MAKPPVSSLNKRTLVNKKPAAGCDPTSVSTQLLQGQFQKVEVIWKLLILEHPQHAGETTDQTQ